MKKTGWNNASTNWQIQNTKKQFMSRSNCYFIVFHIKSTIIWLKARKLLWSIQCFDFTCPTLWHPEFVWYQIYFWITIKMLEDQLLIYYFILYTQIIEVYSMSKVKLKYWYDGLFKLTHKLIIIINNYWMRFLLYPE